MSTKPIIGIHGLEGNVRCDVSEQYAYLDPKARFIEVPKPYLVEAATLGEALNILARFQKLSFEPFKGDEYIVFEKQEDRKYFLFNDVNGIGHLRDVHILRHETEICPGQDLGFPLIEGDIVMIGPLIC
jgi:hypothetical protein